MAKRQPRPCECGCGRMTKGGRFCPGHDAIKGSRYRIAKEVSDDFCNGRGRAVLNKLNELYDKRVITSGAAFLVYGRDIQQAFDGLCGYNPDRRQFEYKLHDRGWCALRRRWYWEAVERAERFIARVEAGEVISGTIAYMEANKKEEQ